VGRRSPSSFRADDRRRLAGVFIELSMWCPSTTRGEGARWSTSLSPIITDSNHRITRDGDVAVDVSETLMIGRSSGRDRLARATRGGSIAWCFMDQAVGVGTEDGALLCSFQGTTPVKLAGQARPDSPFQCRRKISVMTMNIRIRIATTRHVSKKDSVLILPVADRLDRSSVRCR
jgi:hypothetical protein